MSASSNNTTLPPYLFDAAKAAEDARAAEEDKEGKESLWNLEFLRTTKGMLLVAQVVSHHKPHAVPIFFLGMQNAWKLDCLSASLSPTWSFSPSL